MPRRRYVPPRPSGSGPPVVHMTLTEEDGRVMTAHLAGLQAAWQGVRETYKLAEDIVPCSHAKAAIRLLLFPHVQGLTDIDRLLFERSKMPLPDLKAEAGPLAGTTDYAAIAAHAATGCTSTGTAPVFQVSFPGSGLILPVPEHVKVTVPAHAWEVNILGVYLRSLNGGIVDTLKMVGAKQACIHVVSAVRKVCSRIHPKAAALEAALYARAGMAVPEYPNTEVDRWMQIAGDDGSLKAHLDTCKLLDNPQHWPIAAASPDGSTRPVRVPGPNGAELKWPDPVWS